MKENNKPNKLPEGSFKVPRPCGQCRHIEWNNDYKKWWCSYHKKWVEKSEYHECCE